MSACGSRCRQLTALDIANRREGDTWPLSLVTDLFTLTRFAGDRLRDFLAAKGHSFEPIPGQSALDAIMRRPYSRDYDE